MITRFPKRFILAALLLVATVVIYFLGMPKAPQPSAPIPEKPRSGDLPAAGESSRSLIPPSTPASTPTAAQTQEVNAVQTQPSPGEKPGDDPVGSEEPRDDAEQPLASDPREDVEEVRRTIRRFRDAVGENPVGTNIEITRAMLGDNLKQVKLPPPRGSSVSSTGELVDRWGTPYFFHQLSAEDIEVRSAGLDRVMWTGDDFLVK